MSSGAGYPFTLNGNVYNAIDFAGFNYAGSLPRAFNDFSVVANQAAADRAAILAALANNGNLLIPQTQGRLDYISTTVIRLVQAGGSFLWINGLNRPIPSGGVSLANDGLLEATLYYVYAYMNGATMMLEASTTAHAGNASGVRIKSGDATRTFVGMVYMDTGGIFSNAAAKRFVRSYYNRPQLSVGGLFTSGSTSSVSAVEINAAMAVQCLVFSEDMIDFSFVGNASNSGGNTVTQLGIDGVTVGSQQVSSATGNIPVAPRVATPRAEGLRTLSLRGFVSAGTGTWQGAIGGSVG